MSAGASASGGIVSGPNGSLALEIEAADQYRLPTGIWADGVARTRDGVYERFLRVEGRPILVRAWPGRGSRVTIAAMPAPRSWLIEPEVTGSVVEATEGVEEAEEAEEGQLVEAIARCRRALALDDDLRDFRRRFQSDPLLGPLLRRDPGFRVNRSPEPWEALLRAVVAQLIETDRAFLILRRIAARWGGRLSFEGIAGARPLSASPAPATIAALAPAELAALDLAPKRAIALIAVAREIAAGRCDPGEPGDDERLRAISSIGSWTLSCLALYGRGDLDALPAGDLMFLKLVGRLAGYGRRATIAEVEEFYAPYAPYRGLAAMLSLRGCAKGAAAAGPLRYHPPAPEYAA